MQPAKADFDKFRTGRTNPHFLFIWPVRMLRPFLLTKSSMSFIKPNFKFSYSAQHIHLVFLYHICYYIGVITVCQE